MKRAIAWLCFLILFTGCAPKVAPLTPTSLPSTVSEAQGTLIQFFELLNTKQYADADTLYSGDYEQLKIFSSDTDPSDHAKLWADACQLAGLQCRKVRTATLKNQQGDMYIFQVEFSNPDGSLFVLGPCCGSNATDMPPVSQYEYHVTRNTNGKFVVMELPPYVP
jgi:hypothetical protein